MATLKQSTAFTRMFLLVQASDHLTGLTGATPTVNLSKAGAAFAAAAGAVSEVANGWYKVALTTADTNTLGDLAFHITAASADPTDFVDQVTANILGDSVNVSAINGDTTAATNLQKTSDAVARGTVTAGASVTSIPTSAFTPGVGAANQFIGRTIVFDGNTTTTALQGQAAVITASTNAATPTFTVTALTTAPASGDVFSIV